MHSMPVERRSTEKRIFACKYSGMKIAIAQLNTHIGDFDGNILRALKAVAEAKSQGADLVLFPELTTVGYPPRDFLDFADFIDRAETAINQLALAAKGIAIVAGSPCRNPQPQGKDLYNAAFFMADGEVKAVQHKTLLPNYDIFDEYRYFEPASSWQIVEYQGKRLAITICEDLWNVGNENPLYTISPLDELIKQEPDLILNLSASPFAYDHAEDRLKVLKANVLRYRLPLFYANQVGAQTEIIFDGGSVVLSPDGEVYDEMPYFEEGVRTYKLANVVSGHGRSGEQPKEKLALIHQALLMGLRDYFGKLGLNKAVLGLSGGIDSAVVAVLAAQALGSQHVRVLLMPSQHSSDHSVNDARLLAQRLGIQYDIIPIENLYQAYEQALTAPFHSLPQGLAEENLQARIRGMLLMAFSNKFGNILLNTSNKSEMAVGYGTLYGDLCGGLSVIGDLYKTEVYALARYLNREAEIIPVSTLEKPPSAELRPNQKDSDSLPEYDVLDPILFQYIEKCQGPAALVAQGHDAALVARILRLVNTNEFKRYQTAPVLRVSNKAFGMGRRLPIVGRYLS